MVFRIWMVSWIWMVFMDVGGSKDLDGFSDLDGFLDLDGSHGCWRVQRFLLVLQDLDWFLWTGLVFFGLGWFFQGIRLFFRRTIVHLIHILVQAKEADVTGKRNSFYLVSLYWANLRSKKDILATLS
jgi:hypothetical protein